MSKRAARSPCPSLFLSSLSLKRRRQAGRSHEFGCDAFANSSVSSIKLWDATTADQSTSEDIQPGPLISSHRPPFLTEASGDKHQRDSPNFRRSMRKSSCRQPRRAPQHKSFLLPLEIYVGETPSRWGRCVISHLLRDDYFSRHWSPSLLASNGILGFSISRDKMSKDAVTAEMVLTLMETRRCTPAASRQLS